MDGIFLDVGVSVPASNAFLNPTFLAMVFANLGVGGLKLVFGMVWGASVLSMVTMT